MSFEASGACPATGAASAPRGGAADVSAAASPAASGSAGIGSVVKDVAHANQFG